MSVALSQVAEINPKAELPISFARDKMLDFLPMADVSETGVISVSKQRPLSEVQKGFTAFRRGDILIAKITPCFENNKIAVADISTEVGFGSTEFHVVRCNQSLLDSRYLLHLLRSNDVRSEGRKRMTGSAGQQRVPKQFLEELQIPLPPLHEQKRISAILDQAEELRCKCQLALDRLNQLGQAIFVEMFGDSAAEAQQPLASVCDLITDGTHYTPTYTESGIVFLSAKNVTKRRIDWENVKYIPESLHLDLQRRVSPQINDVLLAKNGTTGVAAIVDRDCVFDIYVSLALLRPSDRVLPRYLLEAVNCDKTRRQFDGSLKGIGVSNLHLVDIRSAVIPVPSMGEQKEFVRRIAELERLRQFAESALSNTRSLFASLQKLAFRGEL